MSRAPPVVFPRSDGKVKQISLPEDAYIKKFFQKYPEAKHEDAIKYVFVLVVLFAVFLAFDQYLDT